MSDVSRRTTQPASPEKGRSTQENIPEKIGPYTVEALLEKGGMSILYLGSLPDAGDPITIKVLSPKYLSNPEVVQRFLNESQIIALTDHPNIVKLYGQGEWEGGLYIAMEFIQGISLRQYLLRHILSLRHALEIVIEIALALCHFHTHGVIHRDLKLENILVTESGKIKIIDFGIAQLLSDKPAKTTPGSKKRFIGTPIYMSPEQKENPEAVSYPSDIYSLGIITYELVLGRLSHGQIHLSLMPKGLQKILAKALQPKPEDRYQDVVEFFTDISNYLNSPELQKDNLEQDLIEELSENLRQKRYILTPNEAPPWPNLEIGIACYRSASLSGLYYDFFEISPENFGIIIGESSIKGAESFLHTSFLRGMIRGLYRFTESPEELCTVLNEMLLKEQLKPIFDLSYLTLFPKENQLRYISCGKGNLWIVKKDQNFSQKIQETEIEPIGKNPKAIFQETLYSWNPGDTLIMTNLLKKDEKEEKMIDDFIKSSINLNPKKMAETLLRKVKISGSQFFEYNSMIFLTIQRNL